MKFSYKFSNLLGTVYRKGNLLFTPDGNSVISPVGNKIAIYDLKSNKSSTLPIESRFNFTSIDLNPSGNLLLAVNEEGECLLISLTSRTVLHRYRFKRTVPCVKFSPDGKYLAACKENNVFIFKSPGTHLGEYNPFEMLRVFKFAVDDTTCIDWASDSNILAVGSKDMSVKIYCMDRFKNFKAYTLGSHKGSIVGVFFEKNSLDLTTISSDGMLCVWESSIDMDDLLPEAAPALKKQKTSDNHSEDEDDVPVVPLENPLEANPDEDREEDQKEDVAEPETDEADVSTLYYKRVSRHFLCDEVRKEDRNASLTSAAYHKNTHVLVTGFSTGAFFIYELPSVNLIHSLSISEHQISSIALNNTGDWIAIGSVTLGQLLVWEWQSETYVMKQQGHMNNMTCLTYSPDGMYIATGGFDGKVKLWNTSSGFCVVTFSEHIGSITDVKFSHNRKFIISSSLDGTVRAFDMTRYRNFKTFTSPKPAQFSCLALDSNSEFVAAGGQDSFEIYLWSLKIGRLCEILSGHEGPVVSLDFCPSPGSTALLSGSWDKTARIWNAVESGAEHEILRLSADALVVKYRPDGKEVAVATLDGQITFFNPRECQQTSFIEGRTDLGSGVADTDLISAKNSLKAKAFTSICYSADGKCILAGGQSKNVCIYHVEEGLLMKKFEITQNRSLDGVDDFINRRKLCEWGNLNLVEERGESKQALRLPGVRSGDMSSRSTKPEIRVLSLEFSPTGQAWAAATTEGLLVYALDLGLVFDPFQLEIGITPASVRETLQSLDYAKAIMMAIKLGEKDLLQHVLEHVPPDAIRLCVTSLPENYVVRCLRAVVSGLEGGRHLEFNLMWAEHLLTSHSNALKTADAGPSVMALQKNMTRCYEDLSKLCDFNKYTLQFLSKLAIIEKEKRNKMDIDVDVDNNHENSGNELMAT